MVQICLVNNIGLQIIQLKAFIFCKSFLFACVSAESYFLFLSFVIHVSC